MQSERIEKIKSKKPFEFNDVFVYLALFLIILGLFFAFVFFPTSSTSQGFEVYKGQQKVLTYYFDSDTLSISSDFSSVVQVENQTGGKSICVYTNQNKTGYNLIFIDLVNKSVKITQSTCSASHDCTLMPAIKGGGVIYCAPHELSIVPILTDSITPPTTGGVA